MKSTTILALIAAAVVPATAVGKADPDVDLMDMVASIEEAYPEFHNGLKEYVSHSNDEVPRKTAFLKRNHHVQHAAAHHGGKHRFHHRHHHGFYTPELPNRHPSVEKALDAMPSEVSRLREAKMAAKNARGALENQVTDTMQKMNQARSIKYAMQKKESQLRLEKGKLDRLEGDAGRLEETHDSLVSSLHRMIGPKLMLAKQRFEKKDMALKKEENAVAAWKDKRDQLKAGAMDLIKQKKASYAALLEAEEAVAKAKKAEELARITYEHDRAKAAEQVQSYHYAETRFKAEQQHESTAREAAEAARSTMDKLMNVEHEEESKVDQTIFVRREKLQRKMNKIEAIKEKDSEDLTELEQKYRDWKEKQQERTAEVLRKRQEAEEASRVHAARQQEVLEAAGRKVAEEADDDWGGWGSDSFKAHYTSEDDN